MFSKLLASSVLVAATQAAFGLTVTPLTNANDMANVIMGSGVTINSAVFTGANGSVGSFDNGLATGLGINSGLLMTSGQATTAIGPNNSSGAGNSNGAPGLAALDALIPGYSTHDAASLFLSFTTTSGDLYFNYVFASDEYNEWVGSSFNDVFGFFVDGSSHNVAVIPSTTTPVSINNVNLGSNSSYYRNNPQGSGPVDVQYDGLTTVLNVSITGLSAGEHTILLAIADAGDSILDSGVFIQGKSFSDHPGNPDDDVPDTSSSLLLLGSVLSGLMLMGRRFVARAVRV